jgi:SAM-dependent methyltransferase
MQTICPNCKTPGMTVFYEIKKVPVHSVLLLTTRDEAVSYPTGDIALGFCESCGFISNVAFDPGLHEYSSRYEATQSYSPTFTAFATRLANRLIERHDLRQKDIIEIGCGQGEFLIQLCELGENRGTGFDPAYLSERLTSPAKDRITFIADFYSEKYMDYQADFVCCKMTLEHIPQTLDFMQTVRRSIGNRLDTTIFFQVPNAEYVLRDIAFWDIYYEHCSYFSTGSLGRLFQQSGFDILDIATDYDDQYLMIEAKPSHRTAAPAIVKNDIEVLKQEIQSFTERFPVVVQKWNNLVNEIQSNNHRAVIWGGGSKGVAFLTTLGITDDIIPYAVDINPYKHGMYMAGTGQEIIGPDFLRAYRPDVVIVMNPIYCDEIRADLGRLGVTARIVPV